jgi:AcrR family transcriptional regulator
MEDMKKVAQTAKHTREEWLVQALEVLAREGNSRLRVRRLAADLGVTTGSFYWHFKGRDDFVRALLDHWNRVFTEEAIVAIEAIEGDARHRLLVLMRLLLDGRLARYDAAFRTWAAQDPAVAAFVEKVDARRWEYASSLFREMGFDGDDLKMRVRLFLVYEGNQFTFLDRMSQQELGRLVELRHELLTRR